jgi:hypothetical protein
MKQNTRIEKIAKQLILDGQELVSSGNVICNVGNTLVSQGKTLIEQSAKAIKPLKSTNVTTIKQPESSANDPVGYNAGRRGLSPVEISSIDGFSKKLKNALIKNDITHTSHLRKVSKASLRENYSVIDNALSELATFLNYPNLIKSDGQRGRKPLTAQEKIARVATAPKVIENRGRKATPLADMTVFSKGMKTRFVKEGITTTKELRAIPKSQLRTKFSSVKNGLSELATFLNYPNLIKSDGQRGRKPLTTEEKATRVAAAQKVTPKTTNTRGRKAITLSDMTIFSKGMKTRFEKEGISTAQELRAIPKSQLRTKFSSVRNGLTQLADYLHYPALLSDGQRGRKPAASVDKHSISEMGLASTMFQKLHDAGYEFIEDIVSANVSSLTGIKGIGEKRAGQLQEEALRLAS